MINYYFYRDLKGRIQSDTHPRIDAMKPIEYKGSKMILKADRKSLIVALRATKILAADLLLDTRIDATERTIVFRPGPSSIPVMAVVTEQGSAYLDPVAIDAFLSACKRGKADTVEVSISEDGRVEVNADERLLGAFDGQPENDTQPLAFPAAHVDAGP